MGHYLGNSSVLEITFNVSLDQRTGGINHEGARNVQIVKTESSTRFRQGFQKIGETQWVIEPTVRDQTIRVLHCRLRGKLEAKHESAKARIGDAVNGIINVENKELLI